MKNKANKILIDSEFTISEAERQFFLKYIYKPFYYYGFNRRRLTEFFIKQIDSKNSHLHFRHIFANELVGYASFHYLSFDSNIFNFKMGRIDNLISTSADPNFFIKEICSFIQSSQYDFADLTIDTNEAFYLPFLQQNEFTFMGSNVTYSISIPTKWNIVDSANQAIFREFRNTDLESLISIVSSSFSRKNENLNRFYLENSFSLENVAELYRQWLLNCISGKLAKKLFVAELNQTPVGFIACNIRNIMGLDLKIGEVPLNAINKTHRKKGLYKALVRTALEWFVDQGCEFIEIRTQLTTLAPQLVWQYFNGNMVKSEYHFHKWFKK